MEPFAVRPEKAAEIIDVSRSKFWTLLATGEIESFKGGRSRRVPLASLRAWMDRQVEAQAQTQVPMTESGADGGPA